MSNILIDKEWIESGNISWGGAWAWLTATYTPSADHTSITLSVHLDDWGFYTPDRTDGSGANSFYLFGFVPMRGDAWSSGDGYYNRRGAQGTPGTDDYYQFTTKSANDIWADIAEAIDPNYTSTVSGHLVFGLIVPADGSAAFFDPDGLDASTRSKTITIATNPSTDYDANGKYIGSKPILVAGNRFWNFGDPPFDGSEGFIPSASVSTGDRIVEVWSYTADSRGPILWDYFPGAIKKSTTWQSHNRTAGPDQPGRVAIRVNGSWRDCKNQFGTANPADNKGNIRSSGSWTRQALIGQNQ